MNNSHTLIVIIDKLRVWRGGGWKSFNTNNSSSAKNCLRIYHDQLFIVTENKVLESLNLNGKMKGIYKSDVLILITCNSLQQIVLDSRVAVFVAKLLRNGSNEFYENLCAHRVRKLKFQIKTNIAECLHKLSLHFPVVNFNNMANLQHPIQYRKVEEVLKKAINSQGRDWTGPELPIFFKDFVKICLLDPCFPTIVEETQDILKKLDI